MFYKDITALLADSKNQELIASFLKDYDKKSHTYKVLRNDAEQALWAANQKYDPQNVQGATFTTYAYFFVSAYINRSLYEMHSIIRVPSKERAKVKNIDIELENLKTRIGYMPGDTEVMESLKLSKTELNNYKKAKSAKNIVYIDTPVTDGEGNETTLGALLPDNDAPMQFDSFAEREAENKARVKKALDALTGIEFKIITMYYGLDGNGKRNLEQIAQEVKLTPARCCQIKGECIKKMRMKLCA